MTEIYRVRFNGKERHYSLRKLHTMVMRGYTDRNAEFWSEREQAWRGLVGILFDEFPSRVGDMKEAGITKAAIIGADDDCRACKEIQGRDYLIDDLPTLPPPGCTCLPWCSCARIAKE